MPSWETNCIEDWETKVNAIVEETIKKIWDGDLGIPSKSKMYFEKLKEKAKQTVGEIFKTSICLFMVASIMNPIRGNSKIWKKSRLIELFPASEGFCLSRFTKEKGCCYWIRIFYEFIKADEFSLNIQNDIPLAK